MTTTQNFPEICKALECAFFRNSISLALSLVLPFLLSFSLSLSVCLSFFHSHSSRPLLCIASSSLFLLLLLASLTHLLTTEHVFASYSAYKAVAGRRNASRTQGTGHGSGGLQTSDRVVMTVCAQYIPYSPKQPCYLSTGGNPGAAAGRCVHGCALYSQAAVCARCGASCAPRPRHSRHFYADDADPGP